MDKMLEMLGMVPFTQTTEEKEKSRQQAIADSVLIKRELAAWAKGIEEKNLRERLNIHNSFLEKSSDQEKINNPQTKSEIDQQSIKIQREIDQFLIQNKNLAKGSCWD